MQIVVFGATGGIGQEVVTRALEKGYEVTAFGRDPKRMTLQNEHLMFVTGDVLDLEQVQRAIRGQDAVICALGARSLGKTTIRSQGTANIVQAMQDQNVRRLIVVSAVGTGESWSSLSSSGKMIYRTMLRHARSDHEAQEAVVKSSDLDWTIVRPSGFADTAEIGNYMVGENIKPNSSRIGRAEVAHFILHELETGMYIGKAPTITH